MLILTLKCTKPYLHFHCNSVILDAHFCGGVFTAIKDTVKYKRNAMFFQKVMQLILNFASEYKYMHWYM